MPNIHQHEAVKEARGLVLGESYFLLVLRKSNAVQLLTIDHNLN